MWLSSTSNRLWVSLVLARNRVRAFSTSFFWLAAFSRIASYSVTGCLWVYATEILLLIINHYFNYYIFNSYRRPDVRMRIGHHRQMIGNVRRMRALRSSLQEVQLLLGAVLLRSRQGGSVVTASVCFDATNALTIVNQGHDDVSNDGLRATGQFAVVPRWLTDFRDYFKQIDINKL